MKRTRTPTQRGSVLVMTFILILTVGLVGSALYATSSQQILSTINTRDHLKARVIAESGINEAYNRLKYDFSLAGEPTNFPPTAFGGGTYDVTVTLIGTNMARLDSIGTCGRSTARVTVDLINLEKTRVNWLPDDRLGNMSVFTNYSILAGGAIGWAGGGEMRGGKPVHANNLLEMTGGGELRGTGLVVRSSQQISMKGSAKILGKTEAPSYSGKTGNITGPRVTGPVPIVTVPQIDLTPFYEWALVNGQVRSGSILVNSDTTIPGGVLWVNGNVRISNGSINGCIVATGDIEISTSRTMQSPNGYPLLISRDGNIKITSTPTMTGLVYARGGNVDWQGGGVLYGAIVLAGRFNKAGGSDLIVGELAAPPAVPETNPPGTNSTDYVIISAWQN